MYGWYSEKDAKEKGIIYTYKDVNNSNVMVTKITKENICPYIEESVFGSDCISIGKLIEYVNTKYSLAVSSGTDALLMSLMALEVGNNDEVITSSFA